jgi:hypothetical protein
MIGNIMQAATVSLPGEITTRVLDLMVSKMKRPGRPYVDVSKEDVWFSVSDVQNLCPRLYAMAVCGHAAMREEVDAETLFTFANGTALHNSFQNELLPAAIPEVFQGSWKREIEGRLEIVDGATKGPFTERGWGPKPEGDYWTFWESKGRIPEAKLVGKWDGVLAWPDAPHEVLEVKSIRGDLFSNVNPGVGGRPIAAHLLQVQAYMWMSGLNFARIVYVTKGGTTLRESIAEHIVARDENVIAGLRTTLLECLEAMRVAKADRVIPAKPLTCRIKSDPRARKCACKDVCFALAKTEPK